ncbi:MAG TPA: fibronectin type III domain-containing protein [Bacteroidia bacterium]|nr:fibronectin type III domain-containing protein [Bacteroidia bacterium]
MRPFCFTLIAFFFLCGSSSAQNFPVQLNLQLVPPFSGYLNDYCSPGNENFRVLALFTDFSHPSYDVKLKFKIEGQGISLQNQAWYYAGPFTLEPGVPKMISGDDLFPLMDEDHLDFSGITRAQYDQRKVLPEGFYTITVTAYDYANPLPVKVSNDAVTQAWMLLNDPPATNLPVCGTTVQEVSPQQLTFSWTPMNVTLPSSLAGTDYTFELWEIYPSNSSAGTIVATTAPLYSAVTQQTMLSYSITEPPLVTGREYVWRIRAHDADGRELFRNNGYSQLCTFTWGNANSLLGNSANLTLTAQALTHRQAKCSWDSLSVYSSYRVEFKKTGSGNWFPVTTDHASLRICDLEPETNYEAHVQGIFPDGSPGPWSNVATWATPAQQLLNCGDISPAPAQQNFQPLTQANDGMIWQVGQFEMEVTSLSAYTNPFGHYSGYGKVITPFGGITLNCEFTSITIGDDHQMYAGEVKAVSEGVSNWMTQFNAGQFHYDTSWFYNGNIDSIYVNANGEIVLLDENGNTVTIGNNTDGGVLITDANGNQWIVNPDGAVTFVTGDFLLPLTTDTLTAHEMQLLKMAMTIIRSQLSPNDISARQNVFETSEGNLGNYISTQRQSLPSSPGNSGTITSDSAAFVSYYEKPLNPNDAGAQLGNTYKTAQVDYYSAKVLAVLSRADCPDDELNFIGQYLTVNGVLYHEYVTQQVALGKTDQQIADEVAENGVKQLVVMTLRKQMSR